MNSKSYLRKKAKDLRKNLNTEKISEIICTKIKNLEEYKQAQHVMIFYPMKYEINLLSLLDDKKQFYLPKTNNKDLLVCPYSEDLTKSNLEVMEPNTKPVEPKMLDLVFVPALMVDERGYRLGYGGGYYDRFLSKYPNIKSIVTISKEFITKELPHDNYDFKVNLIIDET